MDWDALKVVLAVHRSGSFSAAAETLGVTHPTIGRRLQRMRDALGVRVFERTPEGWQVTEAGAELVRVAESVEAQMLELDRALKGRDARLAGPLKVWTVGGFAQRFAGAFRSFVRRYPEVELELMTPNALPSLARREADVLLVFTDDPPEQLIGRRVGRIGYAVYAAESVLEEHDWEAHRDITRLPWLTWSASAQARVTMRWIRRHIAPEQLVCALDRGSVMVDYVKAGFGAMFLPCFLIDDAPNVRRLTGLVPEFGVDLWLLHRADLRHIRRVRAFVEHMAAELATMRDAIEGRAEPEASGSVGV